MRKKCDTFPEVKTNSQGRCPSNPEWGPSTPPLKPPMRAQCNVENARDSRANNITHTQHSPTCCFLCIHGLTWLHSQQSMAIMPMYPLHQDNLLVLIDFVNESTTFFKVSTFINNTLFSSTMSLTK
jgi:hypothetical protein